MNIVNYADDNTLYVTENDIDNFIVSLEEASRSLLSWFDNNLMTSNADICHLSVSSKKKVKIKICKNIPNTKLGNFRCTY